MLSIPQPTLHFSVFRSRGDGHAERLWWIAALAHHCIATCIDKMLRRPRKRRVFRLATLEVIK
jgi:hypothetical protein